MSQKKVGRRVFLGLAGAGVGACALSCVGLAVIPPADYQPEAPLTIGFPDESLGSNASEPKILVAYASGAGSTGGVAEAIGGVLADKGARVDVRPVQMVDSLDGYTAAVIGSAIHGAKWLPEADEFLQSNLDALRRVPVAYFMVGMMTASKAEATRGLVDKFLEIERGLISPVAEGRFVGALFTREATFFNRLGLRFFLAYCGLGLRGGDFRNPAAIRAWTESTYPLLTS